MSLCLVEVKTPDLATIAKKLPIGQLEADGRALVPFVKPDVYEALVFETIGSEGATYGGDSASRPATYLGQHRTRGPGSRA
jgi:hypothetical protein